MEPFRDTDLEAALTALRPEPRPAFAAELDERAAAGFPPRSPDSESWLDELLAWLRALSPQRLPLTGGATALAAIAVATVVVAVQPKSGSSAPEHEAVATASPKAVAGSKPNTAHTAHATGRATEAAVPAHKAAPTPKAAPVPSGHSGGHDSSEPQYNTVVPSTSSPQSAGAGSAASGASSEAESDVGSGSAEKVVGGTANGTTFHQTGPNAFGAAHRDVERSAQMTLGAEPSDVGDAAAKVFEAVHAYDGIVLNSSVRGGGAGEAGARFQLLIPSAKLGDALGAFSAIAEVRSRHDATDDITAPTVRLGERLQDAQAKVEGLLVQLAGAESDGERAEVEVELRAARRDTAALRSQKAALDRRANLSHVTLRIESGDGAGTSSGSGGWSAGDALGDAGHILGIAAGVAIVGLAVLAPILLIALLAWLAQRAWLRRSRDRALG